MIVRTIRGDVPPQALGFTDAHEHMFLVTPLQPGDEFSDVRLAVKEAGTVRAAGANALVDWTPIGLGRNQEGLLRVSNETGLHVIGATGAHRDAHYRQDHPLRSLSTEHLADLFVSDLSDATFPSGIIKVGASYHHLEPFEKRVFTAAANAHRRVGAPVCVHTEHGTMGASSVEFLSSLGVNPTSIVLAHLDRNPDAVEHADTAESGAWLQLDGPGRTKYWPDSTVLRLIGDLVERGLSSQLLLGGDTGRRSMLRAYGGGPGMDYLFARFKPRLERELGLELSRSIFVDNPARAFSFEPRIATAGPRVGTTRS